MPTWYIWTFGYRYQSVPWFGVLPLHGYAGGPFCVSARPPPLLRVAPFNGLSQSVNRWPVPGLLASSTSASQWWLLGRTLPSAQRHTVWRKVSMRRAISDHDRPDSYWNRSRRCGKSSGKA